MNTPFEDYARRTKSYSKNADLRSYAGIATFFKSNFGDDWSQIDIALVGLPSEAGLLQRSGTRHGPREMRAQSCNILPHNPLTKVVPFELARIADIGDVPIERVLSLESVTSEIHDFYVKLRTANLIPITAGGDHAITYPILKALGAGRPLGLVKIDAHLDTAQSMAGTTLHHSAPFWNAVKDGVLDPKRTIHIAIRDGGEDFQKFAYETGQTVIDIDKFHEMGMKAVVAEARRVVGDGPTYISFDIDSLDPAYAPGTGIPVVGGLTSYEGMKILHGLRGLDIIGGDVVEVSPPWDHAGITALAGAQMMFEILCLSAEAFARRRMS
ncbi:MAG: agmatinase [Planctomycetes bacterium]|nr:agmatinase [Planctomycetota bacterium]